MPQYLAQIINPRLSANMQALHGFEFFTGRLIPTLINIGLIVGVIVFFFMFIMGGVAWISSAGNKAKLEDARNKITHALIGLVILFSVWAVIQLINSLFGINIGNIGTGPPTPTPIPTSIPTPTAGPWNITCDDYCSNTSEVCSINGCGSGSFRYGLVCVGTPNFTLMTCNSNIQSTCDSFASGWTDAYCCCS